MPPDITDPVIVNKIPVPGTTDVSSETLISFDIVDQESTVIPSTISIFVSGQPAYNGTSFIAPYNGASSDVTPISIGAGDGYHVVIDAYGLYNNVVAVSASADDAYGNTVSEGWSFQVSNSINKLYFSDGYGLKSVNLEALTGESQSVVNTVLSTTTSPSIPNNVVTFIHGENVDGYYYLSLSMGAGNDSGLASIWGFIVWGSFGWGDLGGADSYGCAIIKNESEVNLYRDGYLVEKAQMNGDGTLYLINKDLNRIEVFYGADVRPGLGREPDFFYDTLSTPPIFYGDILDLHLVSGASSVSSGASRFYVGTSKGATKVDTYDKESAIDGYSDGYDGYGISKTYGIVGSGAQYEEIGGKIERTVEVSSDDDRLIMLVGTSDGYGNGGITQIDMSANRKIIFMTKESGLIPDNTISDIFAKGF